MKKYLTLAIISVSLLGATEAWSQAPNKPIKLTMFYKHNVNMTVPQSKNNRQCRFENIVRCLNNCDTWYKECIPCGDGSYTCEMPG